MKKSVSERAGKVLITLLLALVGFVTLYPFWNVLALSFNDSLDSLRGGVYFWPRMFTLDNYITIFQTTENLGLGFRNSVLRTVTGTVCSLAAISMFAYVISRRRYIFSKFLSRMLLITMYINGGLIPTYFVVQALGLRNNFLVYILPTLISAYYVLIFRSYLESVPESLHESAQIDGANDFQVYCRIAMPLCMPVIAALALFVAVDQWNAWFDTYIYTNGKALITLQYILVQILNQSTSAIRNVNEARDRLSTGGAITPESLRMALTIVATVPIIIVYPFIQKYFVSGITLGSVKE